MRRIVFLLMITLLAACGAAQPTAVPTENTAANTQPTTIPATAIPSVEPTALPETTAAPTLEPTVVVTPTESPAQALVYAFAPGKVAIIDPIKGDVIAEITDGLANVEWSDALATADGRLVFANDRAGAQVFVIDTATQSIRTSIPVGPRPVHTYNPLHNDEMWVHSDEEGTFYVINTASLEVTHKVVAAKGGTGHGKLLYGEKLGNIAFATNTNDSVVFQIDLAEHAVTAEIPVCEGTGGTHGKAYSPISKHAYFECSKLGKTAVVDVATSTTLTHLDGSGQLFPTPDGRYIVIPDKANNKLRVLDPSTDTEIVALDVEGGPDKVFFTEQNGMLYGYTTNTLTPDTTVLDLQTLKVVNTIDAGAIEPHEGSAHRNGDISGTYFVTPAAGDGVVSIIDTTTQTLLVKVPVENVNTVLLVAAHQ